MKLSRLSSGASFEHTELSVPHPMHLIHAPGEGPPMLLLHGIGMDWRVWQAVSRRLRPHFDLYMLDLRGHGDSYKPVHGYTLAHYAADVEEILDKTGITGAVLVGSSLGGMVAASVEAPADLVTHRVLVDPPLTGGPVRDPDMFRTILRLKGGETSLLADYLLDQNPGIGRHLSRVMAEMWDRAGEGVILDMLDDSSHYFDIAPALTAIDAPTLILQAEEDMGSVLSDQQIEAALRLLPHGRARKVAGAGHAIHAYKPAEFVQSILDLIAGEPDMESPT
jgi:pimeloyl-ACP methyl ester carboxylesterase